MGSRMPRLYGCRVGINGSHRCRYPVDAKGTLVCEFGHVVTIWMCKRHNEISKRKSLVCKTCVKLGHDNVKCRQMPLVADLPLAFRRLAAQFDSE